MSADRYKRQVILPEIGEAGQQDLLNAHVLCVGAGGLGSPALLYLAAAGIGNIGIVEYDHVDVSNLQRQVLFTTEALDRSKADEAKNRLLALNPDINITLYKEGLNADNAPALFQKYDIILDGTDNFETKFLINDAAVKFEKPWVYGAIQGFDGQASVFNAKGGPCYRCLYPERPKGHVANCAENGVIGAVAGLIGVTQALQVIQLIIDDKNFEPLIGKLWTLDTKNMQTRLLNLSKNPECSTCSKERADIILSYNVPACRVISELSPGEVMNKTGAMLIDVREQDEWDQGHIENAQLWPLSLLEGGHLPNLTQDKDIILYCQKGTRSMQSARILKAHGYSNIYNMSGGYEAWLEHVA